MNKYQTSLSKLKFRHLPLKKGEALFCGYTLVEIMVVVAAVGLIMTSVVGIVVGSFRAQNKTRSDNKITENGTLIINELRKNIFNSYSDEVTCSSNKLSVKIKSLVDGGVTVLSCSQSTSEIASTSATKKGVLNNDEVMVTDCSNFVVCEKVDGKTSGVVFNFGLKAITGGVESIQSFSTRITLRN